MQKVVRKVKEEPLVPLGMRAALTRFTSLLISRPSRR